MSDKKRAAVYVRISTPNQVTDAQEWELREYCEQRGWSLVIYSDHGQSGTQLDRPALNDLMNDVRGRKVDVVVVKALDRLTRSKEQSVAIAEECKSLGVELIALNNFESTLTRLRELPEPEPAPQAKMMIVYRGASMVEGWPEKIKAAQKIASYRVNGRVVHRIRFGNEAEDWDADARPCHDCGVISGEFHVQNCDVEQCPNCGGQLITCDCAFDHRRRVNNHRDDSRSAREGGGEGGKAR